MRRYDYDQEKEKMENKIADMAAPLGGELIFLPPPYVAKRDDSQITRGNNNDCGATATVITWCSQSRYGTTQRVNALPTAATILPLEDETDVGGAEHAVPACDWSWSICLTCEVLQKAITERSGIFLVTSEARTVFAHRLAMTLRAADCIVGFDRRPAASLESPLAALSARLGIKFDGGNRAAWCQRLAEALERQPSATPVLLIDTADLLGDSSIRELATVLDAGGDGAKIRAVLVGRPELQERLEQPDLATVNARVRFRCRLEPLDEMDVRSIIARRLPHDFAIGAIAPGRLTAIGDYIRANPDALAFLWGRSRRLARDSDEPVPSLAYVAKAAQMLSGSADGLGSAMAHGDAPPNSGNAELRGSRNAVSRKVLPRAMVRIATVALIVAVWSLTPSFDGSEHPALTGAALERLAPQSVLAIGQDIGAYKPAPSLQTAMVDDSSARQDDKDTTTTALNPASHNQPPPARLATPSTTRPERHAHGNHRAPTHAVPTARRSNDRPLPTRSIKPLPPERPAQTDGQSPSQIAAAPTVPPPPAQAPPARSDTQLVAASVPTCQPYLSQVDFSGHAARVTGLACHDATGRWWLMSQQHESE
ncbi:MAG TPA: AAA family ATPase [Xanthobacteraceae bacterium]|nr:AAA family ATPase [Xanthobacteraceae bacterium]